MNKLLTKFIILVFIFGSISFSAPVIAEELENGVVNLLAAQNIEIGTVITTNDADNIYVTYKLYEDKITEGWLIKETHLAVADSEDGIPQTKEDINENSNPIPGKFAYNESFDFGVTEYTYEIALADFESSENFYLAAHAVVEKYASDVLLESETAWGEGTRFNDIGNWGMYFTYDLMPQYLLVDTLFVPATNNEGKYSSAILESGKNYVIKVSGTYQFVVGWGEEFGIADAEYSYRDSLHSPDKTAGWVLGEGYFENLTPPYLSCALDLMVNGACVEWGGYNESHLYELNFAGTESTVYFNIYDNSYADNEDGLNVEIYEKIF